MMTMPMFSNNNSNSNSNNNLWNLLFQRKTGGQSVNIVISPEAIVQEAFNKYKIQADLINEPEIKFIFNGKQLDASLKISQSGLSNNSNITVITTRDVEGA